MKRIVSALLVLAAFAPAHADKSRRTAQELSGVDTGMSSGLGST